jgi:pimeloyl-ACP methyl ester carboxylesterase
MHFLRLLAALPLAQLSSAVTLKTNSSTPGVIPGTTSNYNDVRGHTYHYLLAEPEDEPKGTILLLHGLPDLSYGWRYQIPALTELGYRVVAPDMLGYAGTDSPCSITHWTHKELAADLADLLDQILPGEQVIVGGHDWGAGLTYKIAMWHPELVKAFFTITIPYIPPWIGLSTEYEDLAFLVADGTFATLGYQLQWREPAFERNFTTREDVRMLMNTMYGGITSDGRFGFDPRYGTDYDILPIAEPATLVSPEELDFYVDRFLVNGLRGIFNWYRTRRMDYEDELPLALAGNFRFSAPTLFVPALQDTSILPEYYEHMDDHFDDLTIKEVDAGHFVTWEAPEALNAVITNWLTSLERSEPRLL